MDDQGCPRCKTTKYRNPSLKLMVNTCGHTLCESCVDLLFLKGSGSCPECLVPLRRSNFRVQLFEDASVEKEVDIRRRLLRDYNKREEDFNQVDDYNNYLEEIENIIYNLVHDIDTLNTMKKIDQYKKDNREMISKNNRRIGRDEYELEVEIEREKLLDEQRRNQLQKFELDHRKKKLIEREALIDELMASEQDASEIVNIYADKLEKTREESKVVPVVVAKTEFSTGVKFGQSLGGGYGAVPKMEEGPVYQYTGQKMIFDGPTPPTAIDIDTKGYMRHIRAENPIERTSGYRAQIACQRVLQEALQGLFTGS